MKQLATQPVWSLSVRSLHWTLALSMIGSFATHENGGVVHENLGYIALAAASLRVILGFVASGYWRFSQFVKGLKATSSYAKDVINKRELRYLGHNPLGGWMVVALLTDAVLTGFTGWLYTTDRFWGIKWVADLHGALGEALLPLLFLHIVGAIFTSYRHQENLIASMLHGRKVKAEPGDIS
jgi:cytochrome b